MNSATALFKPGSAAAHLLSRINLNALPKHIAIIMDGNGRWARRRGLPRVAGHRAGIRATREVVETCSRLNVSVLTLFAFSMENWKRPRAEVNFLMQLLRTYIRKELPMLVQNNVRLQSIGRAHQLPGPVRQDLEKAIRTTEQNSGLCLNVALNYGARAELVDAFHSIVRAIKCNGLEEKSIDEELISRHLYTAGMPDPDLLIRTSGELRVSNFLLWQIAYSEIWVTPTLWPDFTKRELLEAILDYQRRDRRYGGLSDSDSAVGRIALHSGLSRGRH
ncbi:MAG TPA: isoprenyl transferase [Candidatus Acidoferrales bacterium]